MNYADKLGEKLEKWNKVPFVGFVAGPVLLVAAIAQMALNLLGMLLVALPCFLECIHKESSFHWLKCFEAFANGFGNVLISIYIFCPFTSDGLSRIKTRCGSPS